MKRSFCIFVFLFMLFSIFIARAEDIKNNTWIKTETLKVAKNYSESISCETSIEEKNLIALTPWNKTGDDNDNREDAKYALIWNGDIGCMGGTGTTYPRITVVRISTGDSFVVNPLESSPIVKFRIPAQYVKKITSSSPNSLTLIAMDWSDNDAHCCASVEVKIQLKQNKKGEWIVIDKSPTKILTHHSSGTPNGAP